MNLDDKFEAIQRYMTGQMTETEITDFELELQQSPELAAELHQWRTLRIVAKHEDLFRTKRLLDKLRIEKPLIPDFSAENPPTNPPSTPPTLPNSFNHWLIGSVVGTLVILLGYWEYQRKLTEERHNQLLISVLSKPAHNILGLDKSKPPQSQTMTLLIEAMDLYDAHQKSKYEQAIPKLIALLPNDTEKYKSFAPFYLAMSYLQTGQAIQAEPILKQLADAKGIMYAEARQYLPVALIANGKIKEAKDFLKELSEEEQKMEPAKTLLENL
jgi:Tetratricopeptide repeat